MAFRYKSSDTQRPLTSEEKAQRGWVQGNTRVGGGTQYGGYAFDRRTNGYDERTGRTGAVDWLKKWAPDWQELSGANPSPSWVQQYANTFGGDLYRNEAGDWFTSMNDGGGDDNPGEDFYGRLDDGYVNYRMQEHSAQQKRQAARAKRTAQKVAGQDALRGETQRLAEILGQQYDKGFVMPEVERAAMFNFSGWNDPTNIARRRAVQHGTYRYTPRVSNQQVDSWWEAANRRGY